MELKLQTFWLIEPEKKPSQQIIAGGVLLPDGQVAIARCLPNSSHTTFPSLNSFQQLQDKRGRHLVFDQQSLDGYHLNTFQLVRRKDVTGISGTGVVAVGCYFPSCGGIAVMQWLGEFCSTGWYTGGWEQIELIHGHNGKTQIVMDV
ncbi:hypothetical protein A0J48_015025 [Sphaerospermopsis aphanizomenoides BCCUSP55]|uniref:hypothetical protein n=1 Tax=Sphaerospermopsis aphanizomenoides TaxID=459663 RepID=UPI0019032A60|nr:hypothetical protein [Sphaerospermopsis aphanizomenoides]MBK1988834.1 hypothetical protein [Sphaerospermopsis aphanizomenoides BCCUSP55]